MTGFDDRFEAGIKYILCIVKTFIPILTFSSLLCLEIVHFYLLLSIPLRKSSYANLCHSAFFFFFSAKVRVKNKRKRCPPFHLSALNFHRISGQNSASFSSLQRGRFSTHASMSDSKDNLFSRLLFSLSFPSAKNGDVSISDIA